MPSKKLTDKERLDWLTLRGVRLTHGPIGWGLQYEMNEEDDFVQGHTHKTPRAAIDAAIRAERKSKKGGVK